MTATYISLTVLIIVSFLVIRHKRRKRLKRNKLKNNINKYAFTRTPLKGPGDSSPIGYSDLNTIRPQTQARIEKEKEALSRQQAHKKRLYLAATGGTSLFFDDDTDIFSELNEDNILLSHYSGIDIGSGLDIDGNIAIDTFGASFEDSSFDHSISDSHSLDDSSFDDSW